VTTSTLTGFDFFVTNSGGITVNQGRSGFNTITVTGIRVPYLSVSLSCTSGLPAGASCNLNPVSNIPPFQSTLTISTLSSTPVGSYTITVTGTSGGLTRTTEITLRVNGVQLAPENINRTSPFNSPLPGFLDIFSILRGVQPESGAIVSDTMISRTHVMNEDYLTSVLCF
jgi:hypothetical protein